MAALAATAALEADAAPGLETVVVTATRREVAEWAVAPAVSVIDEDTLTAFAPDVAPEALRGTPGVFFQQTTPGQGIPIVRGLKGSQVLHLVDGIRLNNAFFRDAPNQYVGLVDALMLERVEVLRGAAGSLHGADAMGGVVQFLSREPRFEGQDITGRYRLYGAFDSADRGWLGRAEAASGNDRGSLSGGVSWQDRGDRRTGAGTVRPSGFTSLAGDLRFLAGTPDQGEWMVAAQSLEQPDTPRVDELVPGFGQTTPSAAEYAFAPNRRSLLHGRWRRDGLGGVLGDVEVHLARQVITDDRVTRGFGSRERFTEQNESTLDGLVFQASQAFDPGFRVTWGAEAYRDEVRSARQVRDLDGGPEQAVPSRFPDRSRMDSDAVFLHGDTEVGPWIVNAGLRYSRFEIRLPETLDAPAVRLDPDDLTGDLGLSLAVADGVRLVANLGRGFRPPNVFDLGALGPRPGNRFNVANPDLGPETVWSLDFGVKTLGEGWELEAFVFRLDYEDRIASVPTGGLTPDGRVVVRSENRNEVEIEGLEAGGRLDLGQELALRFALNWTRGEERDAGVVVPADRIPPLNGRLALAWQATERLRLEPFVDFAGSQDRLSPRDRTDPRIDPTGTDGWVTVNLQVLWNVRPGLDLGLRLENLFDETYREHGSGIDAPGFNLGLWVDARF